MMRDSEFWFMCAKRWCRSRCPLSALMFLKEALRLRELGR